MSVRLIPNVTQYTLSFYCFLIVPKLPWERVFIMDYFLLRINTHLLL